MRRFASATGVKTFTPMFPGLATGTSPTPRVDGDDWTFHPDTQGVGGNQNETLIPAQRFYRPLRQTPTLSVISLSSDSGVYS